MIEFAPPPATTNLFWKLANNAEQTTKPQQSGKLHVINLHIALYNPTS